ncbi:component of dynein regulatory complex [Tribonema minus]|uniref:Component of dynein regulatory complex n=1 Tax=Tribonema minus TaxID=303371 RepID=A0A835ZIS7_9STRA|nr:component of dynein regulatory complex [Tribonema minus]
MLTLTPLPLCAARQALCQEADRIFKQTVKEDRDFNEFQQQREKLNYFWIVEKKGVEDRKAELRNKEREAQDLEERHGVEVKIYKQRVKHLLYEHQDGVTHGKTDVEVALRLAQEDHASAELELKADRAALSAQLKEMELSHQQCLVSLKHGLDRNVTDLRAEFERKASEVHKNFERRMKVVRERLEARRKGETAAIEERKNAHIERLMKAHERAFADIKAYYNDITHNNLDLIKSLKEEVAEMRRREQADERQMFAVAQENRRMSEPLRRARGDVDRLRLELERYAAEREDLRQAKAHLLVCESRLTALRWEMEVLTQRSAAAAEERDELRERLSGTVCEARRRAGFRNLLLERKLAALGEEGERREACLGEVLARADVDPAAAARLRGQFENLLATKARAAAELAAEVASVKSAHAQFIHAVGEKLREYGVPKEELGFVPAGPRLRGGGVAVTAA